MAHSTLLGVLVLVILLVRVYSAAACVLLRATRLLPTFGSCFHFKLNDAKWSATFSQLLIAYMQIGVCDAAALSLLYFSHRMTVVTIGLHSSICRLLTATGFVNRNGDFELNIQNRTPPLD